MRQNPSAVFEQIEERPLNKRQKSLIAAAVLGTMLEFYDLLVVAYVLAIIAKPWHLTFGQSAFLLMAAGVGSIVGSMWFGVIADRIGRRKVFMATVLTFSLATGALVLVPDGGWLVFGLLRVVVGLGVGGLVVVDVPLVQEFVPASKRGFVSGLVVAAIPIGGILASAASASLGPVIGWRGLLLLGLLPAVVSIYVRFAVKESPTWLIQNDRREEARDSVAWVLGIPPDQVKLPAAAPVKQPRGKWTEVFAYRRSFLFTCLNSFAIQVPAYGLALWGPSLVGLQMQVTPARAAFLYTFVTLAGFIGRLVASHASDRFGRRRTGTIAMFGATAGLVAGAFGAGLSVGPVPFFYVALIVVVFFLDGAFVVALPYWAEMFPTRVRAGGVGMAYGIGGFGKLIGPAVLAVISGAGTVVTPQATSSALLPAFLFFAAFAVLAAVSYVTLGIETRGLSMDDLDARMELQRRPGPVETLVAQRKTEAL
ncbi:MFS transporter [Amycolatopsis jejuensis]|uniref:MFS transporter n=1 Tax=Amycolatopsis jejuensis TaxID=330084 RepID=UPI00052438C7|nr:MFS transporter [Amycolatopsis jejuensis]